LITAVHSHISQSPSIEREPCSPPTCPTLGKVVQTRDGPVTEAAHYLRISRALLYTLIRGGRIKTFKIGTRTIVRGAELERFLDRQQAA
jgi:excisionase family DNA binding protein